MVNKNILLLVSIKNDKNPNQETQFNFCENIKRKIKREGERETTLVESDE